MNITAGVTEALNHAISETGESAELIPAGMELA